MLVEVSATGRHVWPRPDDDPSTAEVVREVARLADDGANPGPEVLARPGAV